MGMLRRINRLLVAARDLEETAAAFRRVLGLGGGRRLEIPDVGAASVVMALGDAWVQVLQPVAEGPVARFLQERGPGIYGLGVEVSSLADTRLRAEQCGRQAHPLHLGDQELVCFKREQLPGLTLWVSEAGSGPEPADVSTPFLGVWRATNLVEDRDEGAAVYEGLFGRPDAGEACRNDRYGFLGRLLQFGSSPGADGIAVAQVHHAGSAMGRFWRRHGPGVYMVTLDTDEELRRVYRALVERDVRYAHDESAPERLLYIHPSELSGCFVAVSAR
jgi:hypothetical protein